MMRFMCAVLALTLSGLTSTPVEAGVYGDDLAKCLVARTTEADKTAVIQWLFAAISAHPAVAEMARVTPEQRSAANRDFARLVQSLLSARCRGDTVAALKYEGIGTLETSFGVLGQIAMRGLMSDVTVTAQLAQIGSFTDVETLKALSREAGLPTK